MAKNGKCHQYEMNGSCTYGTACKFQHVRGSSTGNPASSRSSTTKSRRTVHSEDISDGSPLAQFFDGFPEFLYDSSDSATLEFYRLCDHFGWDKEDPARKEAHQDFKIALTQQFNANYGTDAEDIASWQSLCARIGIDPIPETMEECRDIVLNTHVNLVDLVDVYEEEGTVTTYDTVQELSDYTIAAGKFFPKEVAYAGELLKYLLRNILNPARDDRRRFGSGGGKGKRQRRRI